MQKDERQIAFTMAIIIIILLLVIEKTREKDESDKIDPLEPEAKEANYLIQDKDIIFPTDSIYQITVKNPIPPPPVVPVMATGTADNQAGNTNVIQAPIIFDDYDQTYCTKVPVNSSQFIVKNTGAYNVILNLIGTYSTNGYPIQLRMLVNGVPALTHNLVNTAGAIINANTWVETIPFNFIANDVISLETYYDNANFMVYDYVSKTNSTFDVKPVVIGGGIGQDELIYLTPSFYPTDPTRLIREGNVINNVSASGSPKTIGDFLKFINLNPCSLLQLVIQTTNNAQLTQSLIVTHKTAFNKSSETINLGSFTSEFYQNSHIISIPKPFQLDDKTELSVIIPKGSITTFSFYVDHVLNLSAAIPAVQNMVDIHLPINFDI